MQRTHNTAAAGPFTVIPTVNGPLAPGSTIDVTCRGYTSSFETLISENGYGQWHECLHYSKAVSAYGAVAKSLIGPFGSGGANPLPKGYHYEYLLPYGGPILWDALSDASNAFGAWDSPIVGLPVLYSTVGGKEYGYTPPDLDNLCAQGVQAIMPGIKPKLSLVNALIELKDFKSLPDKIRLAKALLKNLGKTGKPLSTMFKTKVASEGYLEYSFNLAPTVADVYSIWKALFSVRDQVNRLKANEARYLTAHFRVPLTGSLAGSDTTINGTSGSSYYNPYKCRRVTTYSNSSFVVSIDYGYSLNGLTDLQLQTGALMDNLGVNLNPTIIWNAIPWSFAVDWLIGVGRWLDQYKYRNIEPTVIIYRCMYSVRAERVIDLHLCFNSAVNANYTPVSRVREVSYTRRFFDPNISNSVELSGLSLREFSLASALTASKARKRRPSP